jgi:hypothetical protein
MMYSIEYTTKKGTQAFYGGEKLISDIFFKVIGKEVPAIFGEKVLRMVLYSDHNIIHAWVAKRGMVVYCGGPKGGKFTSIDEVTNLLSIPEVDEAGSTNDYLVISKRDPKCNPSLLGIVLRLGSLSDRTGINLGQLYSEEIMKMNFLAEKGLVRYSDSKRMYFLTEIGLDVYGKVSTKLLQQEIGLSGGWYE